MPFSTPNLTSLERQELIFTLKVALQDQLDRFSDSSSDSSSDISSDTSVVADMEECDTDSSDSSDSSSEGEMEELLFFGGVNLSLNDQLQYENPNVTQEPLKLSEFSDSQAWHNFRYYPEEIKRLMEAMEIPDTVEILYPEESERHGRTMHTFTGML